MRTATPLRVGGGWRDNRVRSRLGRRLLATAAPERAEQAAAVTAARRATAQDGQRGRLVTRTFMDDVGLERLSCAAARPARARRACRPGPGASSPERAGEAVPARTQQAAARPATSAPGPRRPRQPGRGPPAADGRVSERACTQTAQGPRGTGPRRQDSAALPTSKIRCRCTAHQRRAPATKQQRSPTPTRIVEDGHAAVVVLPFPRAPQIRPPLVGAAVGHSLAWQEWSPRPGSTAPPPWLAGSISAGSQGLWPLVRGVA